MTQILDTNHMRLDDVAAFRCHRSPYASFIPASSTSWPVSQDCRLLHRWGGWRREPFTVDSRRHVSVYGPRPA